MTRERLACRCSGRYDGAKACPMLATAEDLLCDHCRQHDCPSDRDPGDALVDDLRAALAALVEAMS